MLENRENFLKNKTLKKHSINNLGNELDEHFTVNKKIIDSLIMFENICKKIFMKKMKIHVEISNLKNFFIKQNTK